MSEAITQEPRQAHTILIRMDKLGDLVLSLPSDQHPSLKDKDVHWAITKGLEFVAEQSLPKRKYTAFPKGFSPFRFFRFVYWLRAMNPMQIVILHAPWWVSMATWWAGIPVRIGPLSQWHSYLFLNFGVRQKRSLSDRHESDYNFDLIDHGFGRIGLKRDPHLADLKRTHLKLVAPNPEGTLSAHKLEKKKFVVIHPGMGGSAFNWPPEHYLKLAQDLSHDHKVIITGTQKDKKYLDPIESSLKEISNLKWLVGELSPLELLDLLSQSKCVVAPSTGVIHLAASLDVPVIGIYSPKRQEHPRRWGPKGAHVQVFVPETATDSQLKADVMVEIQPSDIARAVRSKK